MCAVIFGFMWLQKPSEAEMAEQQRIKDSIAAVQKSQPNANQPTAMLTPDEVKQLQSVMAEHSTDSTNQGIDDGAVKLSLVDGKVTGTVAVGDTTLAFDDLLSASADAKHCEAVDAVKKALDNYAKNGAFAASMSGTEQIIKLRNDSLEVELSTKGGAVVRAKLLAYKAYNAPQVEVFTPEDNQYGFVLSNNTQRFETQNFYFTPEQLNDSTVVMKLDLGGGATWGMKYTLVPGSYMVRMEMLQSGMTQVIPLNINTVDLVWHQKMARHEEGKMFEERNSAIYYKYAGEGGDVEYTKENGDDDKDIKDRLKWISTKNQFFSAVLIADSVFTGAHL